MENASADADPNTAQTKESEFGVISISKEMRVKLKTLKITRRETYDEILKRLVENYKPPSSQ
jgi:hypothetical protein